uniref:Uncharacterized protein n=1 Tax=Arundo donax TaxID=35708 RepID=A0A0A9FFE2_ARUDO
MVEPFAPFRLLVPSPAVDFEHRGERGRHRCGREAGAGAGGGGGEREGGG